MIWWVGSQFGTEQHLVKLGKEGRTTAILEPLFLETQENVATGILIPLQVPKNRLYVPGKLALVHSHKACLWHFCSLFFTRFLLKYQPPVVHLLPIRNKHIGGVATHSLLEVISGFQSLHFTSNKFDLSHWNGEFQAPQKTRFFFSHPKSKVAFFWTSARSTKKIITCRNSSHHPRKHAQYLPSYHIAMLNSLFSLQKVILEQT